jgi:uncharacterized DUF497 family protein
MDFEWDEAKRLSNLEKHKIDFADAEAIFDGRPVVTGTSVRGDEKRFITTGMIDSYFYTVVWMWRDEKIRLISVRRSRDGEKRAYRQLYGR